MKYKYYNRIVVLNIHNGMYDFYTAVEVEIKLKICEQYR